MAQAPATEAETDKTDEERERDAIRHIVQIRVLMNRHDLNFEQAAAVLQLSVLDDLLRAVSDLRRR